TVFGLYMRGATDSAINAKPPVPESRASDRPLGSRWNAPTDTITKQATAMSAAESALRAGRQRAYAAPNVMTPRGSADWACARRSHRANAAQPATSSSPPAPKQGGTSPNAPALPAGIQ